MEMEIMKNVNILGTEYSIEIDDTLEKTELDGLCKEYNKQISVRSVGSMLNDNDSTDTKKIRFEEVLRHEIIHAFFYEAGLEDYSDNEQLIDWIAKQFPKLEKAFKEVDCL
jgi:hypothetical protein